MAKILMIVTNNDKLGDTGKKTGVYLSEFTHPYSLFSEEGHEVDVTSPLGGSAPVDPHSLTDGEIGAYEDALASTLPMAEVAAEDYAAIFIVGGLGVMWDLPDNKGVQDLVLRMIDAGGLVCSVCHGSAVLAKVKDASGNYLIAGKSVTGFSNAEESAVGVESVVPFLLEDAIREAGGTFESSGIFEPKIVEDGNLISGQNPQSAKGAAELLCRRLKDRA